MMSTTSTSATTGNNPFETSVNPVRIPKIRTGFFLHSAIATEIPMVTAPPGEESS
jgi:hypothetical protein